MRSSRSNPRRTLVECSRSSSWSPCGAIEIFVFVQVGQWIGYGCGDPGADRDRRSFGSWLVKREGLGTWRRAQAQMRAGEIPAAEAVDGALIAGAGLLLIVPGFVTDVIGLLLLLPPLRWPARRWVRTHRFVRTGNAVYGRVIDVRGTAGPAAASRPRAPARRRPRRLTGDRRPAQAELHTRDRSGLRRAGRRGRDRERRRLGLRVARRASHRGTTVVGLRPAPRRPHRYRPLGTRRADRRGRGLLRGARPRVGRGPRPSPPRTRGHPTSRSRPATSRRTGDP